MQSGNCVKENICISSLAYFTFPMVRRIRIFCNTLANFFIFFGKEKSRQIDAVWCCLADKRCDLTSFFSDFFLLLWLASLAFGLYGQPLVKLRFLYGKKFQDIRSVQL